MRSRPGASMMTAGTRSTPYSAALSLSSTRLSASSSTSSFSSTICSSARLVGAHVSQPIDCSKKTRRTLLEEVIERFARAVRRLRLRRRTRLALDRHARGKEFARVPHVLRRDTHGNGLGALESLAGVERLALRAATQVGAALLAARIGRNG